MTFFSFLLVVFVTMPDGNSERFIMDSQLTYDDCQASAQSIQIDTARASYVCVLDLMSAYDQPFSLIVE